MPKGTKPKYDGSIKLTMYCSHCSHYSCRGDEQTVNTLMGMHERVSHGIDKYSKYKVDHNSKQFSTYNNNTLSSRVVTLGNKNISVKNIDGKIPSNFELDTAIARSVGCTNVPYTGESSSASFSSNDVIGSSSDSKDKKNKKANKKNKK